MKWSYVIDTLILIFFSFFVMIVVTLGLLLLGQNLNLMFVPFLMGISIGYFVNKNEKSDFLKRGLIIGTIITLFSSIFSFWLTNVSYNLFSQIMSVAQTNAPMLEFLFQIPSINQYFTLTIISAVLIEAGAIISSCVMKFKK